MGYRSTVGFNIVFCTGEDRERFALAAGNDWTTAAPLLNIGERSISFREPWIKWYSEYKQVAALIAIVALAQELKEADGDDRIDSAGYFGRMGEDRNDNDEWSWDASGDGLPYGYDLGGMDRDIIIQGYSD